MIEHDVFLVPAQFATIQQAVDAVCRPSTVVVSPGVYAEDVAIAGKQVVIESARLGRRGVTLAGAAAETVLRIEESSVYLSGVEIRSDHRARGIEAVRSKLSLQECVIAGNRAGGSGAGMLCRSSSVRVQKSTIAGNVARGGAGGGLHLDDCTVEIAGSSIQTNEVYATAPRGGGIWCARCRMRMWRSRVTDNALFGTDCDGAGIYFEDPAGAQIGGSIISGNGSANGRGGGIFIRGDVARVAVHRNSVVRQNHPD